MKVGVFTTDWGGNVDDGLTPGGCALYRCLIPLGTVAARRPDVDVVFGTAIGVRHSGELTLQDVDSRWHDGVDVMVMQRWMHADGAAVVRRARAVGQTIVQDIDDLFLDLSPHNDAWWTTHPRPEKLLARVQAGKVQATARQRRLLEKVLAVRDRGGVLNRNAYAQTVKASDAVWVSTPYLQRRYRQLNPDVTVLRNAIDLDRWQPVRDRYRTAEQIDEATGGQFWLGWMGATSHRTGDWEAAGPHIAAWMGRHDDVRLLHVGSSRDAPQIPELCPVRPDRMLCAPPVPAEDVARVLWPMTVGVVPLSVSPFNDAKSCLKGMEFAAAGVPFVASRSAEYDWWAAGQVVSNRAGQWADALERLRDPAERDRQVADQDAALRPLAIQSRWTDWSDALDDIVAARKVSA